MFSFVILNLIQHRTARLLARFTVRRSRFESVASKLIAVKISLVDRIVGSDEAKASYELFDKVEYGKMLFDPWK